MLVPPGDIQALAQAIEETLASATRNQNATNRAAEFSLENITREYIHLLELLAIRGKNIA